MQLILVQEICLLLFKAAIARIWSNGSKEQSDKVLTLRTLRKLNYVCAVLPAGRVNGT
jgi:hypothetical protein